MDGLSRQTIRQVSRLSPRACRDLLRVLTAPSEVRADVIRQFHERPEGVGMAEALIDLRRMSSCVSR